MTSADGGPDGLRVEIVIPVLNMAGHLQACLASLNGQLSEGDVITVVDDGSSDDTEQIVARAGARYLRTAGRRGPYEARHLAASASTADILLFVDARCRARAGFVDAHRQLYAHDGVALSCTDVAIEVDSPLATRIAGVHDWFNLTGKIGAPGQLDFYPTANLGVLRSAYQKVGGFRRMRSGGDADLCWRVQLAGLGRFGVDPRTLMTWVPRRRLADLAKQSYRYGRSWAYLATLYPSKPASFGEPAYVAGEGGLTAPARPAADRLALVGAKLSYLALRVGYHRENRERSTPEPPVPYAELPPAQDPAPAGAAEEPAVANKHSSVAWQNLRADYARYQQDSWLGPGWWVSERTFWAIAAYRAGQRMLEIRNPFIRKPLQTVYGHAVTLVHAVTGIEIWPNTEIGGGLRIYHGSGLVINAGTRIGRNCLLRQGVTLGVVRGGDLASPTIGDNVEFGTYAQVFGPVTIGDNAKVGALSVVLSDIPAGATAVGAPARIVQPKPPAAVSGEDS